MCSSEALDPGFRACREAFLADLLAESTSYDLPKLDMVLASQQDKTCCLGIEGGWNNIEAVFDDLRQLALGNGGVTGEVVAAAAVIECCEQGRGAGAGDGHCS